MFKKKLTNVSSSIYGSNRTFPIFLRSCSLLNAELTSSKEKTESIIGLIAPSRYKLNNLEKMSNI